MHERILRACQAVLIPIARFLLRAGVNFREFQDLAKFAFVSVAAEEFGLRGRPTNSARVAAITGIPRKEVSRIRRGSKSQGALPKVELSPMGDILHRWHTDPLYLDGDGNPRVIPNDGAAPSFAELARTCSRDLPVGALRVELLRIGAIALVDPGNVRVLKRAAVPESVDDRLVTSLSFNLYCLASTIAFNSNPKRESMGRIERFVQSSSISDTMKASLRSGARLRIEQFTEELDLYFAKSRGDGLDDGGRIGVGVYYFEDD